MKYRNTTIESKRRKKKSSKSQLEYQYNGKNQNLIEVKIESCTIEQERKINTW